jgi:branched-chain amino acid aminotransferase
MQKLDSARLYNHLMTGDVLGFTVSRTANPASDDARKAILADPGFGKYHTDHMVSIEYTDDQGWHDAQVCAYGPIELDPSAIVLHYAQEIFEGLKAYRWADGSIVSFRAEANAARMQASAQRIAIPALPAGLFLESLRQLIAVDNVWVPPAGGEESLYLRPFIFATEPGLGVRPAKQYRYMVIASPAGAYFKNGIKPVTVWVSTNYVRASPGGTGAAKFGGNYAASLVAQAEAAEHDCEQVVWLDAVERRYIEEMGGMNLFFVFNDATMLTPPLEGTILPGITRDSLITLARAAGIGVREERYAFSQWREDAASGRLAEVFACGTAAVVTPVGTVKFAGGEVAIGDGASAGPVTKKLRESLVNIQRGHAPDPYGWVRTIA